ncbi:DinB family protein [Cytophagaceae bacterium DM2B3-1]|uniref:DinB family protein n=1 Tax=Xanthocytophaga flava TaxID=3048013 RepID=A0ABT7CNU2_9BACT|nr:DinB family protein [Xanthocytophaga flavus]MDJ1466219.1 DinB family protein [Xanthocytophaga flavus]MDJ1495424.1 DinB family protein [Xanthocytophaga flavus]
MQLQSLVQQLKTIYKGEPWYGDSILQKLNAITTKEAYYKVGPEVHCIAEIVAHMTIWRSALIQWLKGNDEYNVKFDSEEEWPPFRDVKGIGWESLKANLKQSQEDIIDLLKDQSDTLLIKRMGPKQYTLQFILEGIVEHDVYHLGQIGLLVRLAKMSIV